jgi:hypothetical protein
MPRIGVDESEVEFHNHVESGFELLDQVGAEGFGRLLMQIRAIARIRDRACRTAIAARMVRP